MVSIYHVNPENHEWDFKCPKCGTAYYLDWYGEPHDTSREFERSLRQSSISAIAD